MLAGYLPLTAKVLEGNETHSKKPRGKRSYCLNVGVQLCSPLPVPPEVFRHTINRSSIYHCSSGILQSNLVP